MRRAVLVLALVAAPCSGRALAHGGDDASLHAVLGPTAFLVGVALVAVTLDARDAVAPGCADLGVFVGGALALVGVATYVALWRWTDRRARKGPVRSLVRRRARRATGTSGTSRV